MILPSAVCVGDLQVRKVNRAIDSYNREARAYNAAVNRDRLNRKVARLCHARTTTRFTVYTRSVATLPESFARREPRHRTAPGAATSTSST